MTEPKFIIVTNGCGNVIFFFEFCLQLNTFALDVGRDFDFRHSESL